MNEKRAFEVVANHLGIHAESIERDGVYFDSLQEVFDYVYIDYDEHIMFVIDLLKQIGSVTVDQLQKAGVSTPIELFALNSGNLFKT